MVLGSSVREETNKGARCAANGVRPRCNCGGPELSSHLTPWPLTAVKHQPSRDKGIMRQIYRPCRREFVFRALCRAVQMKLAFAAK